MCFLTKGDRVELTTKINTWEIDMTTQDCQFRIQ